MAHQPQNLVATPVSSTQINLSWDDVDTLDDETYQVERDGVIVESELATPAYSDTGLDADTEYVYRVRAVGGTPVVTFTPPDIAGLVAWYSFDESTTLWQDTARTSAVTADGQVIKGVSDKSGNAKHLSEATNGPAYRTSIINGRAAARFDGTDDTLTGSGMAADTTYTVIIVARKTLVPAVTDDTFFAVGGGSAQFYCGTFGSTTSFNFYSPNTVLTGTAGNVNALVIKVVSSSSMTFYASGGTGVTVAAPDVILTTGTSYYYGAAAGTNFGDYDMGEGLVYDSALAAADLNTLGAYLASRWGFTWTTVT